MATKYYRSNNSDWNTDANWSTTSGGSADTTFATIDDVAIFDANSGSCTLDAAAACSTLTIGTSGSLYTGTLDANDQNVTIGTGGLDCTYGGSATLTMGSGTWNCDGNWDDADIGTKNYETSTVNMTGTGKTIYGSSTKDWYSVTIAEGATITLATGRVDIFGNISIVGTLTVNAQFKWNGNAARTFNVSGTVNGSSSVYFAGGGQTFTSMTGTWSPGSTLVYTSVIFAATGTFGGTFDIQASSGTPTLTFNAGTRTFTGAVTFNDSGLTYTIDNSANPSFVFQSGVTFTSTGTLTWTKGTGSITLSGTNDQTLTFPAGFAQQLEDIVYDKASGTVTLAGPLTTDSLTVNAGSGGKLDFADSSYSHTINGDFTCDGSGEVDCGNATITVAGNFDNQHQTTWTYGTSTVVLSGTTKNFTTANARIYYNLTVSGSYTSANANTLAYTSKITITGSFTTGSSQPIRSDAANAEVEIQNGGTLSGTGLLTTGGTSNKYLDVQAGGTFSLSGAHVQQSFTISTAATLSGTWTFTGSSSTRTVVLPSGTTTFTGAVTISDTGTCAITVNNSANGSLVFQGGVTISTTSGSVTWTKGTGSITLSGTNDQTITTPAGWTQRLEDLVINKASGRVTLAGGNLYVDTLTHQSGDLDLDGHVIDSAGGVSVVSPARFHNGTNTDMDGGSIVVGSGELQLAGAE